MDIIQQQRKILRLKNYDYSQNGAYFITVCTQNRQPLFENHNHVSELYANSKSPFVGARRTFCPAISAHDSIPARLITDIFLQTIQFYKNISCPKFVVMPDHMHCIIIIEPCKSIKSRADMESAPTISEIMQTFKRHSTIAYICGVNDGVLPPFEKRVWQRSFHDHVIRNEHEYGEIWNYIDLNPLDLNDNGTIFPFYGDSSTP